MRRLEAVTPVVVLLAIATAAQASAGPCCLRDGPPAFRDHLSDSLDTDHFRFRYTSDPSSPHHSQADYLAVVATEAEEAWSFYHEQWGMLGPRGHLEVGRGGLPLIEFLLYHIPSSPGRTYSWDNGEDVCIDGSFNAIELRNSIARPFLDTGIAHEVFHAFQGRAGADPDRWLRESTARWAEWAAVPEYRRSDDLRRIVRFPQTTLWGETPFERTYAGVVFWHFLQHRFGEDLARLLIPNHCGVPWQTALDDLLRTRHGVTLDRAIVEFWQWNYHAGSATDGAHYPLDASFGRIAFQAEHTLSEPVEAEIPEELRADVVGTNALQFHGPATLSDLRIRIEGAPEMHGHRTVTVYATTNPRTHARIAEGGVRPDGTFEAVVVDWARYDDVGVLITNHSTADVDFLAYRYRAAEEGEAVFDVAWDPTVIRGGDVGIRVAPNPFRAAAQIRYWSEGGATALRVVDVTGRTVRRLVEQPMPQGHFTIPWDGRDDAGRAVSAGVYLLRLDSAGVQATHRILHVR